MLSRLIAYLLVVAAMTAAMIALTGCRDAQAREEAAAMTGGDPDRGVQAITKYGCGGCHDIRGVPGASGLVGPPLDNIASRVYLAGHLPNTPQNMVKWIRFPQQVEPHTAMPDMRVTDRDARDIAAYLYTLR